ncbi:MAG TPA: dienelactone hydrolase family protein [bacterium]|nr:dienelactone hydrolase family protein [bacterium]
MAIKTETVQIKGAGGTFSGFFAAPQGGGPVPGVVVVQEIFGVNSHMRDMVQRFANAGYAALAPDLFYHVQPNLELGYTPDDIAKGREIRGKLDNDKTVADVKATFDVLAARPECQGQKLGITGYCYGGFITYLAACRLKPAAAAAYYGGGIAGFLGEADGIGTPTQFHFGEKDPGIPMADVDQIKAKVQGKPNVEVFTYADADHGFNCNDRKSYNEAAAKLAWQRTMDLFGKHLK